MSTNSVSISSHGLFLVPVTATIHNFWAVKDPAMAQIQFAMFMKNVSMRSGTPYR